MARNKHGGDCYQCGIWVRAGSGHFEKHGSGWLVKHANVPGDGRVTCKAAQAIAAMREPTDEMVEAACVAARPLLIGKATCRALIDAALKENK